LFPGTFVKTKNKISPQTLDHLAESKVMVKKKFSL